MALKVETDRWEGHYVEIGSKGLELLRKKRGVAFQLLSLEPNHVLPCILDKPPSPCALVCHSRHWVPFWRALAQPSVFRFWLPAEAMAGFASLRGGYGATAM